MSNAITYRMAAGIPGNLTRPSSGMTVEPQVLDTTNYPTAYGVPVVIDATSHGVRKVMAGDTRFNCYGFYVRPYPLQGNGTDGLGVATPPNAGLCDVLVRGYMTALLGGSTPAVKDGTIYVRTANPSTGKVVGDIEAAADIGIVASATTGTGTSTAGTLSASQTFALTTPAGVYKVTNTTTGATAAFNVTDSGGALIGSGNIGTQCTLTNGLSFKITAGGSPTSGDFLTITVTQNTFALNERCGFMGPADAAGNVEIAFNV